MPTSRTGLLPESIGRFKITRLLGRGGMGAVYEAVDPTLQRTVALKTVRPDIDDPAYLQRLYREAQAGARLRHPNIVTVYEAGEIDGQVYIAMEYLDGENLADALERGDMPFDERLRAIGCILDALEHAHAMGVIHRDIKPSNVHRLSDGTFKLVDFGLARVVQADALTATGSIVGTPHYASPEQLQGGEIDRRTDVYSTGALAYELLSGRLPFAGKDDTISSVMLRVISDPPPPMQSPWVRAVPEVESIVLRAMSKKPADRYSTAEEMRVALAKLVEAKRDTIAALSSERTVLLPQRDLPPAAAASRQLWWWAAGAAAAIVAAVVLVPWGGGNGGATATPVTESASAPSAAGGARSADAPAPPPGAPDTERPAIDPARNDPPRDAASSAAPVPPRADDTGAPATPAPSTAKALYASAAAGAAPGLKYRLIRRAADDSDSEVDPTTTFHSGDRVRFQFESNIDGYLYVVAKGSSGAWSVLFPNPDINGGRNTISKGRQYTVPPDDWFLFDEHPGSEEIFVFLSRDAIQQMPGFNKAVTAAETVTAAVVTDLQSRVRSRDLILEKDRGTNAKGLPLQANYVVNRAEAAKAVAVNVTLLHEQ